MITPYNYERRYANARNIQEVIKPHGWCDDDSHSAHGEELMEKAPDMETRQKFERFISKMR